MKIILVILVVMVFSSCNKVQEANTNKDPVVDNKPHLRFLSTLHGRNNYESKTSTIVIFHVPESITWDTDFFTASMDTQTKLAKFWEGLTIFSDRNDAIDEELYNLGAKQVQWDDNECFMYDEIDEDDIPEACVELWDEGQELETRIDELLDNKSATIREIQKLLDYDYMNPYNWKILDSNKEDSVVEFGIDWKEIKNIEINKYGPLNLSYTIANGGIRDVSVSDEYRITFYLHEKATKNGPYTGIIYKFVLDQDASFIERHRLSGVIHKYDAYMNLLQEEMGICKIEFDNK